MLIAKKRKVNTWALTGLYAGVLLLILLGTGRIVFKFVRSDS